MRSYGVDDELLEADRHAADRERKIFKRKHGMRVDGRSTRLLEELSRREKGPRRLPKLR
ncbi:MAG: hypothetical protein QN144_10230 [Armatimonadota bacterium]|nr:hypothetical protein [Armatimonadota bacterium]